MQSRNKYFKAQTISNTDFEDTPTLEWGFRATGLIIAIDGAGPVHFSYNGKDIDGTLYASDRWIAFDNHDESKIWLKADAASPIRLWAWEKRV